VLTDDKFCDLYYKEYRAEAAETEGIYKRYQMGLAAIVLVSGIIATTTTPDHLPLFWIRIDAFLYYFFLTIAVGCLAAASICLSFSIAPRKFERLADLEQWAAWRKEYRHDVIASGYAADDPTAIDSAVAAATCEQTIERLAQATDWNSGQNRRKLKWFNFCFYFTLVAIVAMAFQFAMYAVLFLNNRNTP
jgi:hypothetical protein